MSDLTQAPIVDLSRLEELLDREGTIEICQMFLEDTRGVLDKLSIEIESGHCENVRQIAHMLKGCCKSVTAEHAAKYCAQLEGCGRDNDLTGAKEIFPTVWHCYLEVENSLRKYLSSG